MNTCFAILGLSGGELVMVLVAILVLFGANKIPQFAKGLGQGIKEFKKASREVTDEFQSSLDNNPPPPPAPKQVQDTAADHTVPKTKVI